MAGSDKQHQLGGIKYSCKTVLWHRPLTDDQEVDEVSARYWCVPSFTCKYQSRMQGTGCENVTMMNYSYNTVLWHGPLKDDLNWTARYRPAPTFASKYQTRLHMPGIENVTSLSL